MRWFRPELFAKHGFDMRDGEGVIDLLREIAGVGDCGAGLPERGAYKLSLRSKDREYPVGPLAGVWAAAVMNWRRERRWNFPTQLLWSRCCWIVSGQC